MFPVRPGDRLLLVQGRNAGIHDERFPLVQRQRLAGVQNQVGVALADNLINGVVPEFAGDLLVAALEDSEAILPHDHTGNVVDDVSQDHLLFEQSGVGGLGLGLGTFAIRDVLPGRVKGHARAKRRGVPHQPAVTAVFVPETHLETLDRIAGANAGHLGKGAHQIVGVNVFDEGPPLQLLRAVADAIQPGGVDPLEGSVVAADHQEIQRFQEQSIPLLFRLFALRDVLRLHHHIAGLVRSVANQRGADENKNFLSFFLDKTLLQLITLDVARQQRFQSALLAGEVVGMRDLLKSPAQQLPIAIAQDVTHRAIDAKPLPPGGDQRHAGGRVLDGAAETLLALSQFDRAGKDLSFDALVGNLQQMLANGPIHQITVAIHAGFDQKTIDEQHPTGVLGPAPIRSDDGAVDRLGPEVAAHNVIKRRDGGRGDQHPPVAVDGEKSE